VKAAWQFYENHKNEVQWDLVVINPPFVGFLPPLRGSFYSLIIYLTIGLRGEFRLLCFFGCSDKSIAPDP